MCRLLGILANQPVDLEFSLTGGGTAFRDFGRKNADGWGMGWYEEGGPEVFREPISAAESVELPRLAHREESVIFLCHVRLATEGEVSKRNCHPFRFQNWLFAHNGSLAREPLLPKLNDKHRRAVEGTTDSEVYFHWVLQNVDEHDGDVVEGLRSALQGMDDNVTYSALNFILSDGSNLYAYRDASVNENFYSLNYLLRDPGEPLPMTLESQVGALMSSKLLHGERAVLVSSEKLTNEAWREVPVGSLLQVSPDVKPNLVKIRSVSTSEENR